MLSESPEIREETEMTTDAYWHWRGYTIWFFDGAYDVHKKGDPQPLIEGLPTAEEARDFIRNWHFMEKAVDNPFTARKWRR